MSAKSEFRRAARAARRKEALALRSGCIERAKEREKAEQERRDRFVRTPDVIENIRLPEVWAVPLDDESNGACVIAAGADYRAELAARRGSLAAARAAAEAVRDRIRRLRDEGTDAAKARAKELRAELRPLAAAVETRRRDLAPYARAERLSAARVVGRVVARGADIPRPPRDPLREWAQRQIISKEERAAAEDYRHVWHASRSTVVASPIGSAGGGKGAPLAPQEIAMQALASLRLYEAAVPEAVRATWLDPFVVHYTTATAIADRLSRRGARAVTPQGATEVIRVAIGLLVPVRAESERLQEAARRAARRPGQRAS